jgi:hypothetical protein
MVTGGHVEEEKNFKVRKGKEAMCPKTTGRGKKRLLRERPGHGREGWNLKGGTKRGGQSCFFFC